MGHDEDDWYAWRDMAVVVAWDVLVVCVVLGGVVYFFEAFS